MPWYEFRCTNEKCGKVFARFRRMEDRNDAAICSECMGRAKRILSVPAIIVKQPTKDTFPDVDGEAMKEQGYEWD